MMTQNPVLPRHRRYVPLYLFILCAVNLATLVTPVRAASIDTAEKVDIPAQPYPRSGLRQRLIDAGKNIPAVDTSLQFDIPGLYYPPADTNGKTAAVIVVPDCDDRFPEDWISILHDAGVAVLRISPGQAHPSQSYCTAGTLDNPKHGVTYWAFDALSALDYLVAQDGIDPDRIAIFGYGYGAAAAQFAIYRHGHAKRFDQRFVAMVGLRAQCMSEMDNFVPALLVTVKGDRLNPPAWCQWRMDRDLRPDREPVMFKMLQSDETSEKQATRKFLKVETGQDTTALILDFLRKTGIILKGDKP